MSGMSYPPVDLTPPAEAAAGADVAAGGPVIPRPADLEQLRWGPIWAGLMTAVGAFVLLTLLAISLGLQVAPGADTEDLGLMSIAVTSAIALGAFFVGGFVSSWSAGLSDPGRSLVNGFLVWALWLAVVVVLAALGFASVVGSMGEFFGQVALPDAELTSDELIDLLRSSSWSTLLALGLAAASAALGGVAGAHPQVRTGMLWASRVSWRRG